MKNTLTMILALTMCSTSFSQLEIEIYDLPPNMQLGVRGGYDHNTEEFVVLSGTSDPDSLFIWHLENDLEFTPEYIYGPETGEHYFGRATDYHKSTDQVWISSEFGGWKTTDDGESWYSAGDYDFIGSSNAHLSKIINENVGYFAGRGTGSLIKTTDGGESYASIPMPYHEGTHYWVVVGMDFLTESHGFVMATSVWGEVDAYNIFETTDSGENWTHICETEFGSDFDYYATFKVLDENTFYMDGYSPGSVNEMHGAVSTDRGETWNEFRNNSVDAFDGDLPYDYLFNDVVMLDNDIFIVGGPCCGQDGNFIARGINKGESWELISIDYSLSYRPAHYSIKKRATATKKSLFVTGNSNEAIKIEFPVNGAQITELEKPENALVIMPSASNGQVALTNQKYDGQPFQLIDLSGKIILSSTLESAMNWEQLAKGQYILHLTESNVKQKVLITE